MQAGQLHRLAQTVDHEASPRRSAAELDRRGKMQLVTGRSDGGSLQSCDRGHTPSKIAGSRLRVLPGSCRRTRRRTDQSWSILRHLRRVIKNCYMSCQSSFRSCTAEQIRSAICCIVVGSDRLHTRMTDGSWYCVQLFWPRLT